jgi:hypothetical protein
MNIRPKFFRKNTSVKSILIDSREWFDKVNGNSYWSSVVIVNRGCKNEVYFSVPLQYGYGNYHEQRVFEILEEQNICDKYFARENRNLVNSHIISGLKRDAVAHGKSCTVQLS